MFEYGSFCKGCNTAHYLEDLNEDTGLCFECEVKQEAADFEADQKYALTF